MFLSVAGAFLLNCTAAAAPRGTARDRHHPVNGTQHPPFLNSGDAGLGLFIVRSGPGVEPDQ